MSGEQQIVLGHHNGKKKVSLWGHLQYLQNQ